MAVVLPRGFSEPVGVCGVAFALRFALLPMEMPGDSNQQYTQLKT